MSFFLSRLVKMNINVILDRFMDICYLNKKKFMTNNKIDQNANVSSIPTTSDINPTNEAKTSLEYLSGCLAVKTKTAKLQNEDFCAKYEGKYMSAIAIADGLGSSIDAHVASKIAVENFLKDIELYEKQDKIDTRKLEPANIIQFWKNIITKLNDNYKKNEERFKTKQNVLQTTLITVVELDDRYIISYTGNGCILHIRGDFWRFWNKRWPWCISDLMMGHSIIGKNGMEALYGTLKPNKDSLDIRVLTITKDIYYGDIFVLTTDGICSSDHNIIGRDDDNKLWLEINPHIEKLINKYFVNYFESIIDERNDNLNEILDKYLEEQSFEDDATVGIIISRKTIEYYLQKNNKK